MSTISCIRARASASGKVWNSAQVFFMPLLFLDERVFHVTDEVNIHSAGTRGTENFHEAHGMSRSTESVTVYGALFIE